LAPHFDINLRFALLQRQGKTIIEMQIPFGELPPLDWSGLSYQQALYVPFQVHPANADHSADSDVCELPIVEQPIDLFCADVQDLRDRFHVKHW
jgi:hypothetical protein